MFRALVILLMALSALSAQAADRYVRKGAPENGSGVDWANAYPSLPSTLVRGDTYWVADGSYESYTFDDAEAGSTLITIRKATGASHGTNIGWSDSYGDGQAVFGEMIFKAGHYVLDGVRRNEANWTDSGSYGIRVTGSIFSSRLSSPDDVCADNLQLRFLDIGAAVGTGLSSATSHGLYLGGFGGGSLACEGWTLKSSHVHNTMIHVQCAGCSGMVIEHTYFGVGWGKEAVRGQVFAANNVIRHSIFKDSCQRDPGEAGTGCTAEIAMWGENTSGAFSGNQIYGNVFQKTTTENNSGGVIVIGGNGSTWVGTSASNTRIYNNTLVGFKSGTAMILVNGGSGNDVRNNIWFDIGSGVSTACSANSCASNVVFSSTNPFIAYPSNLALRQPTNAGSPLAAPYNTDLQGNVRGADGVFDLGAYEFGGVPSATLPPQGLAPPTNLRVAQ